MNNHETNTDDKVNKSNPSMAVPVNFLMTAHQASSLLRKFVTANFSTNGPTGYEYQTRTLYTPEQIFAWLGKAVDKTTAAIRVESALAQHISERIQHDQNDDDDYDEDDETEDEDDEVEDEADSD